MRRLMAIAYVALAATVSACAGGSSPSATIEHRRAQGAPAAARAPETGAAPRPAPSGSISAEPLSPAGSNRRADPAPASSGQRSSGPAVTLPERPPSIVIQPGDTLFSLTERYQISLEAIIEANDLKEPYTLYVGNRLNLPPWPTWTVRPGDTISEIAMAARIDMPSLILLNDIPDPNSLRVGRVLILPEAPPQSAQPSAPARPAPSRPANRETPPASRPAPAPSQQPAPPAEPAPRPVSQSEARGPDGRFSWPLLGDVIASFGPTEGGQRNDGVNIRAAAGTPVRAAAAGTVEYAGNEIPGYGDLLLIKHDGGWITAYAHNGRLLVEEGATVRAGQAIAEVGQSGSVTSPQLHFEVRKGVTPVDPMHHLPPA